MSNCRRDFVKDLLAMGALSGLVGSSAAARALGGTIDQETAQSINPDFDPKAFHFWSNFLETDAKPITTAPGQQRGGQPIGGDSELQPVFLHYGTEGFKNAAELDTSKLVADGDVMVSLNTSAIKVAAQDQETFNRLQNAQIRVDVAQKTAILPIVEAMAYTMVAGMHSSGSKSKGGTSGGSSKGSSNSGSSIQSIDVSSDVAWQKMQNIPLPGGEGRWALNLEAQKKDSLFCQILQIVVKGAGQFAPMIGLPGIAMSGLQSFNILYGAIHSRPVNIIKANPLRVFATQEAIQKTGAPGSVTGIVLKAGTYILIPAKQLPSDADLKNLTVTQGRLVPPKTAPQDLDAAATETLKDVTYVTFDVGVTPTNLIAPAAPKKSA